MSSAWWWHCQTNKFRCRTSVVHVRLTLSYRPQLQLILFRIWKDESWDTECPSFLSLLDVLTTDAPRIAIHRRLKVHLSQRVACGA